MAKALGEIYTIVENESIAANDSWSQSSSIADLSGQHMFGIEVTLNSDSTESVSDEEISFTTEITTYDTGYEDLSSVVITSADELTTFTVDVDYTVNSETGVITFVDSGTSGWANDGTTYLLSYDYTPVVDGDVIVMYLKSLDNDIYEDAVNGEIISILTDITHNNMIDVETIPIFGLEKAKIHIENHDALHSVNVTIKCRNTIL